VSKPSAPRTHFPALWIVAILVAAVAAVVVVAPNARLHGGTLAASALASQPATPAARARIQANYAALPLAFEANQGQTDPQVKYLARGKGYRLFLTSSQAIMALGGTKGYSEVLDMMMNKRRGPAAVRALLKKRALRRQQQSTAVLRMNLLGANSHPQMVAEDLQPGTAGYFIGQDRSKWHTNIPMYGRVNYRGVYPGVDLAFHGLSQQLEFDYVVGPGADATPIALNFEGADSIRTNESGDLILATSAGPVQLRKPLAYQTSNGVREAVTAGFVLKSKNEVAFALGPYDHARALVIDPVVTYSTYFGGSGADYGISIAVDGSGNAYVTGATDSPAVPGFVTPTLSGSFDVYVTKISSTGTLGFTSEYGGSGDDFPGGIAIDSQGIYIAGTTNSSDFAPISSTAAQKTFLGGGLNGMTDAFAMKLGLDGTPTWGTYVGGSNADSGLGVAVDSSHDVYLVGETFSGDLGGVSGGINALPGGGVNLGFVNGADDGYIVKLKSDGTAFLLLSYLGGSMGNLATGVALDKNGNIYVSGETISTDLTTTPANVVQPHCGTDGNCNPVSGNPQDDAFAISIKQNGTTPPTYAYNYVTYYGGSGVDDALAIAVDRTTGSAFLTGRTKSSDFPKHGTPYEGSLAGTQNTFVVELNSVGTAATESTYFGGNGSDFGFGIALDGSDNVYLTGQTSSTQNSPGKFPLSPNAEQSALNGSTDAFVSVLNLSQSSLLYSTYLGGGGDEDQFTGAIALDSSQNVYVTGDTDSGNGSTANFPTAAALDGTYGGGTCTSGTVNVPCPDAFVTAFTNVTAPDFGVSATTPSAVSPGSSGTSTVTLTAVNGYSSSVNLACAVTGGGTPAPACSASSFSTNPQTPTAGGATSTLTITTTGKMAGLFRSSKISYAAWLPILGLSLAGMRFGTTEPRRRRLLGFLLLGTLMAMLFFLPACSSGSGGGGGGGGGCTGCTPAGNYTVTITGSDSNNLSHSTQVTLHVN